MRGSPLLHLILLLIGLALTGVAVWHVAKDRAGNPVPEPAAVSASPSDTYQIVITTSIPASLEITYAGTTVGKQAATVTDFTTDLALPAEGGDLVVSAQWEPSDLRGAVRVEVSSGGDTLVDKTFWGEGSVHDVCTVERGKP